LLPLLPELGKLLLLSDEEKIAYEQTQAAQAQLEPVVVADAPLPPPPEPPAANELPPPPLMVSTLRPPDPGGIQPEDFDALRPPPAVVVAAPPPPPRPRIAVLSFAVRGDPAVVPPGLGPWTAENITPYFYPAYELVDGGEVNWYMGRMGMTFRDLLTDPSARR